VKTRTTFDQRLLHRLVHARESLSRNRNPELFEGPETRRVVRDAQRLRGVLVALSTFRDANVRVSMAATGERQIELLAIDGTWSWRSNVDPYEWEVLRFDPVAAERLDKAVPGTWLALQPDRDDDLGLEPDPLDRGPSFHDA
jgi:hypothetical protein